ncbi:MAG: GTP diphosphokinase [Alteromonadaceae bacterium]|nr:MAG: GTP diphosphokinase [Alteromonadaceae bacterium]
MVKVREDRPTNENGELDIASWVGNIIGNAQLKDSSCEMLRRACLTVERVEKEPGDKITDWGTGYSSYHAGLEMAEILSELHMDEDTLVAAILYRSIRENKLSLEEVRRDYGATVTKMIDGVRRMAAITTFTNHDTDAVFGQQSDEQAENVRKMLVAMVDDVRVALIKLAERTCAIRAVKKAKAEKRLRVAREVSDIYAPLAHRLGIGHIKWELEDLAFRYLQPYDYKYIAKLLDERRLDRQTYIDEITSVLEEKLSAENIKADISGRAKHIYSIWRKMRRKNIGFSEVYDIRAVRILVDTERECYAVLGIVHALWRNIPYEFDDYIATPKENGYRSLHTAVVGSENRALEVQIRTHGMHEEAEFGVCAHWRYKNTDSDDVGSYEQKIEWLRQVLDWHDEIGGLEWEEHLPKSIEQDRIYVFTPDGHVIELPDRATPVDFAFKIHTDVGIRCRGAKVNGKIVPLNHALRTADQVEVIKGKRESPSRDWLNDGLGYITTSKARSRLHNWFKQQDRDQNIADGRALLDHEFKRLAVDRLEYDLLIKKLNVKSLDDLYAAVGNADVSVDRVIQAAHRLLKTDGVSDEPAVSLIGRASNSETDADIYIDGVGNLLSHIAQCCKPIPGDSISGYITLGRGVSIHRQDCSNILQKQTEEPDRIIAVDWAEEPDQLYSVGIYIEAFDRHGLLRDITTLLDREKVNVSAMRTQSLKEKNVVEMSITIEIVDFSELSRVLGKLNHLPNVCSVRRQN